MKLYIYIYKKIVRSINMPNTKQNNKINHINKEINLLQDLTKKNKKSKNQLQNQLVRIGRIRVKDKSFSNQKNTKYIEEYIPKSD